MRDQLNEIRENAKLAIEKATSLEELKDIQV